MAAAGLTFLGGATTVGGVQILARTSAGCVLFDLGVVGNPGVVRDAALFHEFLWPRPTAPLQDYLRAGMAPLLRGLYDPALLPLDVERLTRPLRRPGHALAGREVIDLRDLPRAAFVSHLHDDHAGLARFVRPQVPVLTSEGSARLWPALVHAGEMPAVPPTVRAMAPRQAIEVGDLVLEVVPVDHDILGASGLLGRTADGSFAYTGDWRGHGSRPELMERFAERCHGVDVLITDSSCTGHTPDQLAGQVREPDVAPWFADVLASTTGTAFVALHPRNLERHEAVRRVAVAAGRRVVLDPVLARLWCQVVQHDLVEGSLEGVAVWDVGEDDGLPPGLPRITPSDVTADRDAFVAHLPTGLRPLLLDVGAGPGDTFVHMNGHPFGSADPHWQVLVTWTRMLGMQLEVISAHGHALPGDLAALVEAVRPGLVVPVHTNAPQRFPHVSVPVRPVAVGETVPLSESQKAGAST